MRALIVNPRSGGGKVARVDLIAQCAKRGIDPIVLEPGDDLAALAATPICDGADTIGMAGGDGSQATVAAVAAEHDVAFVCVPAGTRDHFALDAFDDGTERRIDLGRVNGRVFVNNVARSLLQWFGADGRLVRENYRAGLHSHERADVDLVEIYSYERHVTGLASVFMDGAHCANIFDQLAALFDRDVLTVPAIRTWSLENSAEAYQTAHDGRGVKQVLLPIGDEM